MLMAAQTVLILLVYENVIVTRIVCSIEECYSSLGTGFRQEQNISILLNFLFYAGIVLNCTAALH